MFRPQIVARYVAFAAVFIALVACRPDGATKTPQGGAQACSADALGACEERLAQAVALGEGIAEVAQSYADARADKDGDDPFAKAVESARDKGLKTRAVLLLSGGAKDPGVAKELPRAEVGALEPVNASTRPELLAVAIAEASGLDYVAILRPDGHLTRAFGRDPLVYWMAGLAPVVEDRDASALERDLGIERELRAAFAAVATYDYTTAAERIDALDKLIDAEPAYDAQALRGRVLVSLIGLPPPAVFVGVDEPQRAPEPEPLPHETGYYDLLRVRSGSVPMAAYAKRKNRIIAAAPKEMRAFIERTWSGVVPCEVLLPPTFDRPRDLGFAHLLPAALLPAGAREVRGRVPLAEWYPRYERLVSLVERSKTAFWGAYFLILERGGASSIVPTGQDAHRRVEALALKHARGLERLAKAKPGRVGIAQLNFIASPGAYTDESLRRAMTDLARLAAQGSLAQSTEAWDVLLNALTGVLLSGNMPDSVRQEHLLALSNAFTAKLDGELKKQTGWGPATAYAVDLVYRSMLGFAPSPQKSVAEISRALENDPTIAQPGLAALTSALASYAVLAGDGTLGSPFVEKGAMTSPTRNKAKSSLSSALERLVDGAKPDPRVLAEVASLADNATATLAFAVVTSIESESADKGPLSADKALSAMEGKATDACAAEAARPTDPRLTRALAKLRDQRRNLLGLKGLKTGQDAWSQRARLVALLLSDAIDVASAQLTPAKGKAGVWDKGATGPKMTTFFVPAAESERIVRDALTSFGADPPVVEATDSAYALTRGFLAKGAPYFSGEGRPKARALLSALAPLLSDPAEASSASALLLGLASAFGGGASVSGNAFVDAARGLYDKGRLAEADMVLLAAVVATSLSKEPLTPKAFDLATEKHSQMAWLFDFLRYARPSGLAKGEAPLPAPRFRPGLDALLAQKCVTAGSDTVAVVLDAVERFRKGDRDTARADLEAALKKSAPDLVVPHVSFSFKQETRTRAVNLAVDVGLGAPFIGPTGGLSVGGGFKTAGEPKLLVEMDVDSADSKRARDDTARYYVHANATLAIYHFLSGDPIKGERAAARALGAVSARSWLHAPGVTDEPGQFGDTSRTAFAILGQQAIESGRPFLAGSLLSIVRDSLGSETSSPEDVVSTDNLPTPLQGIADLEPVIARTKKTLGLLAAGLPCAGPKSDKAYLLKPTCAGYPLSVTLRIADSVAAMPELTSGKKSEAAAGCKELALLDAFLVPAQAGKYEPDKLLDAVDGMLAQKKGFEAAFLLTRPRAASHCTDRVVEQMRRAAEQMEGVATMRADLLTAIVNCEVGASAATVAADLTALDRELEIVGDPSRQIQIGLFTAALSVRRGEPLLLESIVKKKGFLESHRQNGPLLPIALMLDHLASALAEKAIDVDGTRKDMDLLCGLGDLPAGPDTCKTLKQLRKEGVTVAERKKQAELVISQFGP